jgi:hypothetical protein
MSIRAALVRRLHRKEINMRFLSIYTHDYNPAGPSPELIAKMGALIEEGMKSGWLIATEGVKSGREGFVVRSTRGDVNVVDGPFAEAKEVIGGYAILEAPSRDAVIELTRRFLAVAGDGVCQVYEMYAPPK